MTPRADVVAALRADVAALAMTDARGRGSQARFLAELERLPRPLCRDADATHVTASGVVVGPRGTLLHRHKRLGVWLQPGGHIDPAEDPWDAAVREVAEETGIVAWHPEGGPDLVHVDVHDVPPTGHTHLDLRYRLHGPDVAPNPPPEESQEVRWFAWNEAITLADPGLVAALRLLHP